MKTAKTWHLSVFLECFLPFLNSKNSAEAILAGVVYPLIRLERPSFSNSDQFVTGLHEGESEKSLEMAHAQEITKTWRDDEAVIAHLRNTRDLARRMVRVALVPGEEGNHDLWEEIRAARFSHGLTWSVAWLKPGQTFSTWAREPSEDIHKALTAFTIAIIADAFQAIDGDSPSAAAWCGVCPRKSCGKIFEKKRKDQRWCGDSCRGSQGK